MNFVKKDLILNIDADFRIADEIHGLLNLYQAVSDNLNGILISENISTDLIAKKLFLDISFDFNLKVEKKSPLTVFNANYHKIDMVNNQYINHIDSKLDIFFDDYFKKNNSFLSLLKGLKLFADKIFFEFYLENNRVKKKDLFEINFIDLFNSYCLLFKNKLNIKQKYKDKINIKLIRKRVNFHICYELKIDFHRSVPKKYSNLVQSFEIKKHEDLIDALLKNKHLIESSLFCKNKESRY